MRTSTVSVKLAASKLGLVLRRLARAALVARHAGETLRDPGRLPAKSPQRPAWLQWAAIGPLCLVLIPVLPLVHQAITLAIAVFLKAAASSLLVKQALMQAGLDPVYASVFNRTLGNIEARGLAVASPLGDTLHQLAPDLFATPDKVLPGAWASALVADGVSLLASAIAMVGTEVIFIAGGLALLWLGLRSGRALAQPSLLAMALVGLMLQSRGLVGLLGVQFSMEDIEIMGLSHVFTKLFPVDAGSYGEIVAEPFNLWIPYLLPLILVSALYGTPLAAVLVRNRLEGGLRKGLLGIASYAGRWPVHVARTRPAHTVLLGAALLIGLVFSQRLFPALADYNYPMESETNAAQSGEDSSDTSSGHGIAEEAPKQTIKPMPSKVLVTGANYAYTYTVNGQPERVRGIGYNVMYSHLPPEERAARYDRDFELMREAGVNIILGWEREQFDELTLEKAQEYGLGIVMPYYLAGHWDYSDPAYVQQLEKDITEWVRRFQKYPAVRMWGLGNEVIHSMGRNPETPRAHAFARAYVKLADAIHAVDPDHPVAYRDAEDLYHGPIRDALKKDGVARPWFVYGLNFFTMRVCDALNDWPKRNQDTPVFVSEFAPSGLSQKDRPKGYLKMLRCIAKQKAYTLGAFAYTWTTSGPEAIDRVMGLVDGEGQPVDPSLSTLGKAYRHNLDADAEVFRAQE